VQREFWLGRWEEGQIGWHQSAAHRALPAFWPDLGIAPGARVFVPLCGKSLDMVWLRERGHAVVGIDLSAVAARAFFEERGLTPQVASIGALERWTAGGYEYWVGDLFALTERELGPVAAVYDRAALVALPPDMRSRYYGHLRRLGGSGCRGLLISFEYDQSLLSGPPFCVRESEIVAGFGRTASVRVLERAVIPADNPRFTEAGVRSLTEVSYALETLSG